MFVFDKKKKRNLFHVEFVGTFITYQWTECHMFSSNVSAQQVLKVSGHFSRALPSNRKPPFSYFSFDAT
jgi:hypothetical protein